MKTRKFQITFEVEVDEKELKGLSAESALEKVVGIVEATWDLGQDKQKEDRPDGSQIDDSYGFVAELIDG